jgi:serine/threonine-protein kinase
MAHCPSCRARIPDHALHCVECGKPLHLQTLPDGGPAARMRALVEARRSTGNTLVGSPAAGSQIVPLRPTPVIVGAPKSDVESTEPELDRVEPPSPEETEATVRDMPRLRPVPGVIPRRPEALPQVGDDVEGYEILEEVGKGGMGRVYRARHKLTGQEVALKMLLPRLAPDKLQRARFVNEAKVLARLDHPNLVPLLGFLDVGGRTFIVMPFVRGITLDRMLRKQGRLAVDVAVDLFDQIAAGLGHVHSHQILHRDLKPANVIVRGDGRVMLTDFGIARAIGADKLTATGMVVGTAEYLAPEQASGESRDDLRSDIYALGVLLYEMLTGQVPFRHPNAAEVLRHHVSTPPPPPRLIVPDLPAALEEAVLRSLAKDPDQRFADVGDFRQAVRSATRGLSRPLPEVVPAVLPPADVGPAMRAAPAPRPAPAPRDVPTARAVVPAPVTPERGDLLVRFIGLLVVVAGVGGAAWFLLRQL